MESSSLALFPFIEGFLRKIGLNDLEFLYKVYFGNTVFSWITAILIFVIVMLFIHWFYSFVVNRLKHLSNKTKWKTDKVFISRIENVGKFFYFAVALFFSVQHLALPSYFSQFIKAIFLIAIVFEVIKFVESIVKRLLLIKLGKSDLEAKSLTSAVGLIIRIVLWGVGILMILSNLGLNVTSLIASLGIGGLAVSLALQPMFQDMFSSFSILLDKPFEEGDFIVYGSYTGTVKQIGMKTTRITALQGEEIVIPNAELTSGKIQNFKKMKRRRVVFGFGVEYGTPSSKLIKIPKIIAKIAGEDDLIELDRAHFNNFGDFSLNYEVVYYIMSSDYMDYMNSQQAMNLKIIDEFEKEGIAMAFPTTTVHISGNKEP